MKDLTSIGKVEEQATLELYHPVDHTLLVGDKGDPMTITVYGSDSKPYRAQLRTQQNKRLQQASRTQRMDITAESLEEASMDLLVSCTVSWNIFMGGKVPECTPEKVREVYEQYPWIREQVDRFIQDRRNFMKS